MKFLVCSDLHEDFAVIKKLLNRASDSDIDFVICAGDFTVFNKGMRAVLKMFEKFEKPVYVIPGNHEEGEEFDRKVKEYKGVINFHKSHFEIDDYVFLGYGGDGFSRQDPEFRKIARKWYGEFKNRKIVLVTHGPAAKTKLDKLKKLHVGNLDYRKFIERIKPKLAICGHIHETMGEIDEIGETKLVNPCWEGMVIELN